jgi:NAD+ synthase
MNFSQDILTIDAQKTCQEIRDFIRHQVFNQFKKEGAVVGLSGGIDSALTVSLCVKALGKEKVLGVILPEKESNPKSSLYARKLADKLKIKTEILDITPVLESLGTYQRRDQIIKKIFPEYDQSYKAKIGLPQNLLDKDRFNIFLLKIEDKNGNQKQARLSKFDLLGIVAATDMKQRTRMTNLYYFAEKNNYIVAGTTNKSEVVQGFFVKYGDGGVDIEPIAHLYKTQVYQLAKYLEVPEEIITRTPSPDTFPSEVSDQEFYFCLPYNTLDLLLYVWEKKVPPSQTAEVLGLTEEQIQRVFRDFESKKKTTAHLGILPPTLESD